ncbi:MAG: hypothetical protein IPG31_06460 [Nitrosomonas sp.]|nr:hypothetical protein [Nitrosomonas sp.]
MKPYQQMSFADAEYANKGKVTRREKFLDQLDGLLPWQAMIDVIEPHYVPGNGRVSRVNYLGRFDDNYDGRLSLLATS